MAHASLKALKLAERTIQFADTLTVLTDGYIRAGRVLHEEGLTYEAAKQFTAATKGQSGNILAAIGLAQTQMKNGALFPEISGTVLTTCLDEPLAAIHTLDSLLQANNANRSPEATALLASLRTNPRPGQSSSDQSREKVQARELFDRVCKALALPEHPILPVNGNGPHALTRSQRKVAEDIELHSEIAKLFFQDDTSRVERALQEAVRLSEASGRANPRLVNNLAALRHLANRRQEAQNLYERALTDASNQAAGDSEAVSTTILYNLARVYEDEGQDTMAKEAYDKLLSRHPEYIDGMLDDVLLLFAGC